MDLIKNDINLAIKETSEIVSNLNQLSRVKTVSEKPLKVINKEKFNYIVEKCQEINDKVYNFSKSNSQVTHKLMTLTMLYPADSVYRQIQQIIAQIERKQQALVENINKIKKKQLKIKRNQVKIKQLEEKLKNINDIYEKELIEIEINELNLDIEKYTISIANVFSYIEATLKEIGYFINTYEEIKKNKGVSDDWDEYDFEKEEIRTHIKNAFRNAIRDFLVHGRLGMGTCEYLEQMGISPFEAVKEITELINIANNKMNNNDNIDYDQFYDFLNNMADKYQDCYKKACKKIGINPDILLDEQFLLKG